MPGMNINLMRNAVLQGQIATITAQIETWKIYADRTDEDVSDIVAELTDHISRLEAMFTVFP